MSTGYSITNPHNKTLLTGQYSFERILIEKKAEKIELTKRILEAFPHANAEIFNEDNRAQLSRSIEKSPSKVLFLERKPGRFIKLFPNHPWHYRRDKTCSFNLIIGYNCNAACAYCFNRSYFKDPFPTLFINTDDMLDELHDFLTKNPQSTISNGEFMDSFFLDAVTRTNEKIMNIMREFPASTLELRTKSIGAGHLQGKPQGKALVAWSLNPPSVIEALEKGTPQLEARLEAGRELCSRGYSIAVRIDPVIMTERFEIAYKNLANRIEDGIGWRNVSRVFMGSFRFNNSFLRSMVRNVPQPSLFDGPYIRCPDGKYRADKFTRIRFFKFIADSIRTHSPDIKLDLSMEPAYIWKEVFEN